MLPALAGCSTAAGPEDEDDVPIQFINETPVPGQNVNRNKRLVRSHISKLNRQRTKGHIAEQLTWTDKVLRPPAKRKSAALSSGLQSDSNLKSADLSIGRQTDRSPRSADETDNGQHGSDNGILNLRPISPLFGALKTQAFTHHTSVDESANYYLRIILPNAFLPTQEWFKIFCNEPLVFHGFSAVCNLHLAMADTYSARTKRQRMLVHKTEAIRLVNEKLSYLTYDDIEPVMLGMFTLYPEDEEIQRAAGRGKTAFVPHLPWADDMDIYIGGNPDTHRRAIAWLVDKAGGIEKLNLPGLAKATATLDPSLDKPCHASAYSDEFLTFGNPSWTSQSGFGRLASHLPATAVYCFKSLSCIDRLMAEVRRRRLNDDEAKVLITSRNTVHHRLLSMEPQNTPDESGLIYASPAIYECCRLACLVYSQCVVFPVPSWTDGIRRNLAELRLVLELLATEALSQDVLDMILWASLVGSVAALHTSHRSVFMKTLRDISVKVVASSLAEILAIARQFVWSDSAGEQGAAAVWELAAIVVYPQPSNSFEPRSD